MNKTKRTLLMTTALMASSMIFASSAMAQKVMKVATWLPPTASQNAIVLKELKADIEKATDGRVTIKVEYGMGHPKDLFDMVESGTVDMAWSYNGYMPGRFTLSEFAELPLHKPVRADEVSAALWKTYTKYFMGNGEYDGVELAGMFVHAPSNLHLSKPIKSLDELKGKKIRIGGGFAQKYIAKSLGVVGVNLPAPKVYETLSQGIADGVFLPNQAIKTFKLHEVAKHVYALDLFNGVLSYVVNKDFMKSLGKDEAAVRALFGERLSRKTGKSWQMIDDKVVKWADSLGNITRDPAMQADFKKRVANIDKDWIAKASKKNKNAEKALKEFRSMIK